MAATSKDHAATKGAINKKHRFTLRDCKKEAENVIRDLPPKQQRCAQAAQEKGTGVILAVRPANQQLRICLKLHKGAFKDAVALRYGWPLRSTPSRCHWGVPFDIDHVMSCHHGGFQSLRHNETIARYLLARLFAEVCSDVCMEPRLQPLSGESLSASAKMDDEARLDIPVRGFWGIRQHAFFDVRVFYPLARAVLPQFPHSDCLPTT